ncbi:MAG: DUF1236 domain-containing protein [Hyphomicrobiales bacterium]|nr:DUF1236 domain-containing protein [Hyphomicrobiales bacterium]
MRQFLKYGVLSSALATVLLAGPAFAISGYSTAHLNLRTGPGTQYPVEGVMDRNVRSEITGCLADYSWCAVQVSGVNGWASAEYLVVDEDGKITHVNRGGASTGIPVLEAEGFVEIAAVEATGVIVSPGGHVEAIVPEEAVIAYIAAAPVESVPVTGEIVVGAHVPDGLQLYEVPNAVYGFAILNHVPVLVDVGSREIVYMRR